MAAAFPDAWSADAGTSVAAVASLCLKCSHDEPVRVVEAIRALALNAFVVAEARIARQGGDKPAQARAAQASLELVVEALFAEIHRSGASATPTAYTARALTS